MSLNYRGDPLSDQQIVDYAETLRRHHGLGNIDVPDVIAALQLETIPTRFGEKVFGFQVVDDEVLGGDEAVTLITRTNVRVRLSRTTFERASCQDRRARLTVAHEMMHGVLHSNATPLARAKQQTGTRYVAPFVSVERQANVGASAYLITDAMLRAAQAPSDLADFARVSFEAADIRWERYQRKLQRGNVHAGLKALKTELETGSKGGAPAAEGLLCPSCGTRSLMPIGIRYLCVGPCDRIIDGFADGDGPVA